METAVKATRRQSLACSDQAVNLRFRDGSIYQATGTGADGSYSFSEVFPFFKWLVPEVDFARFKATGMTTAIDYGGEITNDGVACQRQQEPCSRRWPTRN